MSVKAHSRLFFAMILVLAALMSGCQTTPHQNERSLAHDVRTGEYIGIVITQCIDWQSKKTISYKIRRKDGSIVERSPETITIDEP